MSLYQILKTLLVFASVMQPAAIIALAEKCGGLDGMKRLSGASFRAAAWSIVIPLCCAAMTLPLVAQSGIGNDEVRVSSRDYFLTSGALRVKTAEVQVEVVVRDANGRPVRGLTSDDFKLFDKGQARKISGFSVATSAPVPVLSAYSNRSASNVPAAPDKTPATDLAQQNTSERPRFIALFFDDTHGTPGDIGHARNAAERFVREALTERTALVYTRHLRMCRWTSVETSQQS